MEQECVREIVTCVEMARMCGLSRSRFYSLVKEGIMPQPSRREGTNRPCYTREQQAQCLLVRKTNCGVNGKPVLFYAVRPVSVESQRQARPRSGAPRRTERDRRQQADPILTDLRAGLSELGVTEISDAELRGALADEYPDGHANMPMATLLMVVFRRLNRPDRQDNVAG